MLYKCASPTKDKTSPRACLTAEEETDLDEDLEVAEQLLNSDLTRIPQRITRSQRKKAIEGLQEREIEEQSESEPEAKSSHESETESLGIKDLFRTPEMTTPSGSTDVKPDVKKEESSKNKWVIQIATSVVDAMDEKKEDSSKGPTPEPYEGDHKDTCRFLFDLELYFKMNPSKGNTDEKKKMILLSLLKGKTTEWKMTEQEQLFPEDDDPEEKKKAAEETWSAFKARFKKHWQPVDVVGDTQMRICDLQMKEWADDYVNQFRLLASQTGYDDVALMMFFKEGLVPSLQDKIMLRSEGPPETLDKWYEIAIRYDNQYKFAMANKKRRQLKETVKLKINRKEKEVDKFKLNEPFLRKPNQRR
ncbi:hypothetical protein WG66_012115 [Moniliophthora roreri]|nr:hypothetical protein WG66_012115 [Moniliophthora roreri]